MRRFILAAALLSLSGCASYIEGGPLLREGEPTGTLRLINDTNAPISVVLVSNCGHSTYGLNRLPKDYAIPVDGSYDFKVSAGCWDVSAGAPTGYNSWTEGRKRLQVPANTVVNLTSNSKSSN